MHRYYFRFVSNSLRLKQKKNIRSTIFSRQIVINCSFNHQCWIYHEVFFDSIIKILESFSIFFALEGSIGVDCTGALQKEAKKKTSALIYNFNCRATERHKWGKRTLRKENEFTQETLKWFIFNEILIIVARLPYRVLA